MNIKKLLMASIIFGLTASPALAVPSVWGIKAGSDFNQVKSALDVRGCTLQTDISTLEGGRSRETFFNGVFFGRPCTLRARFRADSLRSFQFFFVKKPDDGEGGLMGNYSDLTAKLRTKYGYDRNVSSHAGGETQVWNEDGVRITLACDSRSASGHTTSLTYDFE